MREENAINSPIEIKLYVYVIGVVLRFANLSLESIYKITTQQQQRIETLHSEFKTIHKIIHRFTWFVFQKKTREKFIYLRRYRSHCLFFNGWQDVWLLGCLPVRVFCNSIHSFRLAPSECCCFHLHFVEKKKKKIHIAHSIGSRDLDSNWLESIVIIMQTNLSPFSHTCNTLSDLMCKRKIDQQPTNRFISNTSNATATRWINAQCC